MDKWQGALKETTHLFKMYQDGIDYQLKLGIREQIPNNIRFYEGKQWPRSTENTKNLPRPVINIVKMICRSKKSAILSAPVRIIYKSYTQNTNLSRFNSFADNIFKDMGQEKLDRLAIDDGIKKGSYFYHYFWDKEASDITGRQRGAVRCELIDPLNIFFENPSCLNEQMQKWILIASFRHRSDIFDILDKDISLSMSQIKEDENDDGTITVFTRYFRIDGEVYCERGTKSHIINKPFPIAPQKPDFGTALSKNPSKEWSESKKKSTSDEIYYNLGKCCIRAGLYPIACGFYERREGSIYGISEIEGIIPNQKAINFNIAMSLLNAQECAWGKYIALPNALKGQKISNVPGQVLIDHTGTGEGIKRMDEQPLSEVPINISSSLIDITKKSCGVSEIMNGELIWHNISGAAIAQLQAQAQLPIEELKSDFWDVKRKQGLIIAQFMKLYFYNRVFITKSEENGVEKDVFDTFSSEDYESSVFDVEVEVCGGVKATVASDISVLDACLSSGSISLEAYIKAYPDCAISNKTEILKQLELERSSEVAKLKEELKLLKEKH